MSIPDISASLKDRPSARRFLCAVGELQQDEPPEALWPQYGVSDRASAFFQRANLGVTVAPELDDLRDELGHGPFNAAMRYLQTQRLIEPKGWEREGGGLSAFLKLTDTGQQVVAALLLASTTPAGGLHEKHDRVIESSDELLGTIDPLIRQRRLVIKEAQARHVLAPEAVEVSLRELTEQADRVREIRRQAAEPMRLGEIEELELELIAILDGMSQWT